MEKLSKCLDKGPLSLIISKNSLELYDVTAIPRDQGLTAAATMRERLDEALEDVAEMLLKKL